VTAPRTRLPGIDIVRGIALIGMAIFHFTVDLEMVGAIAPGTVLQPFWMIFARTVAGSFVFLAGVSLVLASHDGLRWRSFLRGERLVALAALAIKLDSPGPIFFWQVRVGENGRLFRIIKLRTMVADAEAKLDNLVDLDALAEPAFKLKHDPRVTRVGRLLRRTSLDEAPQFYNVLRGDMSLVGPRPEEVRVVQLYRDDQRRRLAVKPGMTGPMQVSGRGDLAFAERLQLELEYIENYSLRRDLEILLRTFPAIFHGDGAH